MAASKWQLYHEAKKYILQNGLDIDGSAVRMKIVKGSSASKVSDYTRSTFASCGTGLTFSGTTTVRTPPSLSVKQVAGSQTIMWDSSATIFTASGSLTSIQYAVIGLSNGLAIGWNKLTATAISLAAGNTLKVELPATGYFTLTGGNVAA